MTNEDYHKERSRIINSNGGERAATLLAKLRVENPEHSSVSIDESRKLLRLDS